MKFIGVNILLILFLLTSCKPNKQTQKNNKETINKETVYVDSVKLKIDSAKIYLDSAHYFVIRGIKGEISMTKSNELSGPLMKNFFRIYKSLPKVDTLLLYKYRVKKVNELIDLQIQFNN